MTKKELSRNGLFAGYSVTSKGKSEFSIASKHQIQKAALLLNEYENIKEK